MASSATPRSRATSNRARAMSRSASPSASASRASAASRSAWRCGWRMTSSCRRCFTSFPRSTCRQHHAGGSRGPMSRRGASSAGGRENEGGTGGYGRRARLGTRAPSPSRRVLRWSRSGGAERALAEAVTASIGAVAMPDGAVAWSGGAQMARRMERSKTDRHDGPRARHHPREVHHPLAAAGFRAGRNELELVAKPKVRVLQCGPARGRVGQAPSTTDRRSPCPTSSRTAASPRTSRP